MEFKESDVIAKIKWKRKKKKDKMRCLMDIEKFGMFKFIWLLKNLWRLNTSESLFWFSKVKIVGIGGHQSI